MLGCRSVLGFWKGLFCGQLVVSPFPLVVAGRSVSLLNVFSSVLYPVLKLYVLLKIYFSSSSVVVAVVATPLCTAR